MCGIAGCWQRSSPGSAGELEELIHRMTAALVHRGPDDGGVFTQPDLGLALGHRRLSILDLSPLGHQPMTSKSGRFTLVYNGEVYNHEVLRGELESSGSVFRGRSDTETLVEAVDAWGLTATLERCIGMFALGLWDHRERTLTLARDRVGIKPVYFGWSQGTFLFASELKSLRTHPAFSASINRDAVALLMQHNYVPAPHSIYTGIRKLPAGGLVTLRAETPPGGETIEQWWNLRDVIRTAKQNPFIGNRDAAVEAVGALLRDSVRLRMLSDVPLGAFLSGGIDSTTVVAAMQAESTQPVSTFTVGFRETAYDEAPAARQIANHLGTSHTEFYVSPEEALATIPQLPTIFDEPFADSSQIPTLLVCQAARQHVTVCLSGDGGDELFGGYSRYGLMERVYRQNIAWLPAPLRHPLAGILRSTLGQLGGTLARKASTYSRFLDAVDRRTMYARFNTHWKDPLDIVPEARLPETVISATNNWPADGTFLEEMMGIDTASYLPDDILTKVDRTSMSLGLEVRVPLLDHRLLELAWSLPLDYRVNGGVTKWPLRVLASRSVPAELLDRPKQGFGLPIDTWLRGPLRDWAENLLSEERLSREGLFRPQPIREKWQEHLSGRSDWHYYLWDVLMFQAWQDSTHATP